MKHVFRYFSVVFFLMVVAGGVQGQDSQKKLSLKSVGVTKKVIRSGEETTSVQFSPSAESQAKVTIYNSIGETIKTILEKDLDAGPQEAVWDGRDSHGDTVPNGVYYYTVWLKTGGREVQYNPYPLSHGKVLEGVTCYYDRKNAEYVLNLPQAAMARIRVNVKTIGPILATPLPWTPLPAGEHRVPWDGMDDAKVMEAAKHPGNEMKVFAYSLGDNAIIVEGGRSPDEMIRRYLDKYFQENAADNSEFSIALPEDRYIHARKYPLTFRSPEISLEIPGGQSQADGSIEVKGKVPFRVSIAPRDLRYLENSRYEIMFYIDATFLFEDESGFSPFTYMWDTAVYPDGEHIVTVNLLSYDDHYAVATKKVVIRNKTE